jgi:phosphomannomutase
MNVLDELVKTYDVRGLVGSQLTEGVAEALGFGFAQELELSGQKFAVGYDMRDSSPALAEAFARGAALAGAEALSLGLCSTDMTYFASGSLALPAVMFTASHNPASYNGIKFSRAGARGISFDTGLANIRDRAKNFLVEVESKAGSTSGSASSSNAPRGQNSHSLLTPLDITLDYVEKLRSMVSLGDRRLKVVVDAANGMGGYTVPLVLGGAAGLNPLNLEIVELYFELDGSFPNHEANPLDEKNLADLKRQVLNEGADLGLAFDGDADRCFVVDERGEAVSPSAISAIVAKREVARVQQMGEASPSVIHNLLTSRFVAETIAENGAVPVETRVGHSLIKDRMAETQAVFGGEHSAHYYFRDFWGADNGMLAALHVLAELSSTPATMSELSNANNPYFQSGEINSTVEDPASAQQRVLAEFSSAKPSWLDGLTLADENDAVWWWLNLRSSNTEPLLRLNVESNSLEQMQRVRDLALSLIRDR